MKRDLPVVSVVIPTFNRAQLLPDALDSVFAQGSEPIQVLVIDDGSTDDTEAVVAAYGRRVEYLVQQRQGVATARNRGIALARGELVAFLDSDDVWLPGKLAAERILLGRFPAADGVFSDSELQLEGLPLPNSWFGGCGFAPPASEPFWLRDFPPLWVRNKLFATCALTVRRAVIGTIGGFDVSLESYEDFDFALRLHRRERLLVLPEIRSRVRRFDDGTRGGRPLPGGTGRRGHDLRLLNSRRRVLLRARNAGGWSPEVDAAFEEELREVDRSA